MRFHDPTRCPDCGATLPDPPVRCSACDLPLTGQTAAQLAATLRYADQLLTQLRRPAPLVATPYPAPATGPEPAASRGPRATSVPAILLGLGALCLLVAALVFLAVAWTWLGIGGRTVVLLALTATAAGGSLALGARGLRVAGESLAVVALGLVLLDTAGAGRAGWLGTHVDGVPPAVYGGVLALAALALLAHPLRLVAPQAAIVLGVGAVVADLVTGDHPQVVLTLGVVVFAALAGLGGALRAPVLAALALVGGATTWATLLGIGLLDAAADLSLRGLWVEGGATGLLVAAALLALPTPFLRPPLLRHGLLTGAATVLTAVALLPAIDEDPTFALIALGVASLAWSATSATLPRRLAGVTLPTTLLLTLPMLGTALTLGGAALERVGSVGAPFTRAADVRFTGSVTDPHPLLLLGAAAILAAALRAVLPPALRLRALPWTAAPVAFAALGTAVLYGAPLAAGVAGLALLGAVVVLLADDPLPVTVGAATLALAVLVALPSAALTAAAAVALAGAAGLLTRRASYVSRVLGGSLLPLATATTVWAGGEVAGLEASYRSLVAVGLVGAFALARPKPELEAAAAVAAIAVAGGGVQSAGGLAIHLTLAGALVTASALIHRDRRPLGWVGGLLLAAATWVRLGEIGVTAPEAYTMPTALALVAVGLHRVLGSDRGTGALLPGLALATVPTLTWALADPISARAVVLGAGCLALVLLGARLRWSAPLLVGAVVGGVLVLREAAPYLAETPQWVLIGTAGLVLTGVGVTWERRVVELRRAGSYVGRLR